MKKSARSIVAVACIAASAVAWADGYPSHAVKIVVPFAPGGNLDVTARLIGKSMEAQLHQPFVVENRAGAGGALGSDAVAKAPHDGYTLVAGTNATTIVSPLLIASPPYELASFAPVGMMAVTPLILEVPSGSRYPDFAAFLADVRANPGKVSIGHSGNGTTNHIAILLLQDALKVQFNIVPYKGSGPALVDLMGGQIDSMIDQTSSSLPQIQGGKLRALAVATRTRIADLPSVPTLAEQGVKDFEAVTPSGLLAPAKTPPEVLQALNAALNHALAEPAIAKRLAELGSQVRPMSVDEFGDFMKDEERKLKALVKSGLLRGD
jgi:tripartite-type tricarboxylate transporter receptor subunit TctC